MGDIMSTVGGIMSTVGDIMSTVRDVQYYGGYHDKCEITEHPHGTHDILHIYHDILHGTECPHSIQGNPHGIQAIPLIFIMIFPMALNIFIADEVTTVIYQGNTMVFYITSSS